MVATSPPVVVRSPVVVKPVITLAAGPPLPKKALEPVLPQTARRDLMIACYRMTLSLDEVRTSRRCRVVWRAGWCGVTS